MNGRFVTIDGRQALRFERKLPHPIAKVWKAISDPAEVTAWLSADVLHKDFLLYDEQRALSYKWENATVSWKLAPEGNETLLVLTHTFDGYPIDAPREAAGWHICLEDLGSVLDDKPVESGAEVARFVSHKAEYVREIPEHGRATFIDGHPRIKVDRWMAHPPEKIWSAITDNDQLRQLSFPEPTTGKVLEWEPPRVFAYSWGDDVLRWEVWDFGEYCRLVFTHDLGAAAVSDAESIDQHMAGWHSGLVQLTALLEGHPEPRDLARGETLLGEYRDLNADVAGPAGPHTLRQSIRIEQDPAKVWPVLLAETSELGAPVAAEEARRLVHNSPGGELKWELAHATPGTDLSFSLTSKAKPMLEMAMRWNRFLEHIRAAATGDIEPDPFGNLGSIDTVQVIHLVRRLPQSPEKVWTVITAPEHLKAWFPATVSYPDGLRVGAELHFGFEGEEAASGKGVVLECDEPNVLAYSWNTDDYVMRFEIVREGDGCLLYLSNSFFEGREQMLRNLSGWHACLDSLVAGLTDKPNSPQDAWPTILVNYNRKL